MSRRGRRRVDGGRSSVPPQRSYADDEDDDSYRFGGSRTPSHETLGVRHGGIERNRPSRRTVQTSRDTPILTVTSPSSSRGQFRTSSCGQTRSRSRGQTRSRSRGQPRTPSRGQTRTPSRGQTRTRSRRQTRTPSRGQTRTPSRGQTMTRSRRQSRTPSQIPQSGSRSRSDGPRSTPAQAERSHPRSPATPSGPRLRPAQADSYRCSRCEHFMEMDVARLPGVSESDAIRLRQIGINKCGDLVTIALALAGTDEGTD